MADTRSTRPGRVIFPVLYLAGALLAIVPWWLGSGSRLGEGGAQLLSGIGGLAGLLTGYVVAVQLILMSRVRALDRFVGTHRGSVWHRRAGWTTPVLITAHVVLLTAASASRTGNSLLGQFGNYLGRGSVQLAVAGIALLAIMWSTSAGAVKRRLRYEVWHGLHLVAYVAVGLLFFHQIQMSGDLTGGWKTAWIALYVGAFALALYGRVLVPLWYAARHSLEIAEVKQEAPGVTSILIKGEGTSRITTRRPRAGQFLRFRFLTRRGMWQAHPFSMSNVPTPENGLRITVKASGDHTRYLQELQPGTRVIIDGPYGDFTLPRPAGRLLFIAAGIGITPIRSLLEELPPGRNDAVLYYRARTPGDLVLSDEIDTLAAERAVRVTYLVGASDDPDAAKALGADGLTIDVPDIAERDVYLCGPPAFMRHLRGVLHAAGVPKRQVHTDPFEL